MKKLSISLLLLATVSFVGMASVNPVDGEVDIAKSKVNWEGKKVTGKHHGSIDLKEASLEMKDGMLTGGSFTIDMTSIKNIDMAGKDGAPKLEGHLKSPDFFNVAEYPTATLQITDVVSRGTEGEYKVVGDLTIKGITKPIKFNAHIGKEDGMHMASANIEIDRAEYDVRYGSGSFFDGLADKTIYDEFTLDVKLVLK
ncbi:MAG: YceI family protein [Saprospiraceae bacterium]|nr:YceI family protein [Saprospiraceae bacterium]